MRCQNSRKVNSQKSATSDLTKSRYLIGPPLGENFSVIRATSSRDKEIPGRGYDESNRPSR
jgi:hypothetical protein